MVKKKSIASFIEKLPMDGSVGDCESTLLMTNMDFMGSGTNGDGCTNKNIDSCDKSVNKASCVNEGSSCKNATNDRGCMNIEPEQPPKNIGDCYCVIDV